MSDNLSTLEQATFEPNFWDNRENSQSVLKKIKSTKATIDSFTKIYEQLENLEILIELAIEENDTEMAVEAIDSYKTFLLAIDNYSTLTLLNGEYDINNVVLSLNAGAGGTESCDWVAMLYRMYTRYANIKGWDIDVLDENPGDEAGIKSVTVEITGDYAYGHLKSEKGVHRLVRISPFDSSGRRHTSFASCSTLPVFDTDIDINIKEEDLRIDTYRSSGAGGQHVNKTDSAIRITHLPTGIVVQCQSQRSQHKNKDSAMKILKSKLYELELENQKKEMKDIKGVESDIAWGSQIRSYVFNPYSMVKDHRTNFETGNIKSVMDGELEGFVTSFLKEQATK